MAGGDDARGDRGNLFGRLALAEHHFGKALAGVPVLVDAGETQVLVRSLAQKLKELARAPPQVSVAAGADLVEQGAQLLAVHRANGWNSLTCGPSWTVI